MIQLGVILMGPILLAQAQGTAPAQKEPPQNDPKAIALMAAMPDAYAKLDSFTMRIVHRATVDKQTAEVVSDVLAMKPNLFVIDQTMQGPQGTEKRRFVCDGAALAFPEPRHPDRFIDDPHPLPQWAGNLRGITTLTLDGAWPLGVVFRTKEDTQTFIDGLSNVKYVGRAKLTDGSEGHMITADVPGGRASLQVKMGIIIGDDGFMRRFALETTSVVIGNVDTDAVISGTKGQMKGGVAEKPAKTVLTWDITLVKNPQLTREMFKLPPLQRSAGK